MLNNLWTLWLCSLKGRAGWQAKAPKRQQTRVRIERLEPRTLLAASFYVDDTFQLTNDADGSGGLSAGDTVTFDPGKADQVTGLTFGTNAFSDVQSAIKAASAGDTVFVAPGTYPGSVNLNKDVTVSLDGGTTLSAGVTGSTGTYDVTGSVTMGSISSSGTVSFSSNLNITSGTLTIGTGFVVHLDGRVTLDAGTLFDSEGIVIEGGGALIGNGTLSSSFVQITGTAGLDPGNAGAGNTGTLSVQSLQLGSTTTTTVDLNSPTAGTGYDRITGSVLGVAGTLMVNPGNSLTVGDKFTILQSGIPFAGTFSGLPEGAKFTAGGYEFGITYQDSNNVRNRVVLTVLDTPPVVTITSPTITAGVGYVNSSSPTISGTVTDAVPAAGIASVTVSVDGGPPVAATLNGGNWSAALSGLADGTHSVAVFATGNNSNSSETDFSLMVDTVAPTVVVATPTITSGIAYSKTGAATISGTVLDGLPSSGITSVTISIDGGAAQAATLSAGNWSYSAAGLLDGNHTVSVSAADKAGNVGSTSFTLDVDTVAPVVTETTPTLTAGVGSTNSHVPTISGTVSDPGPGSGISTVLVSIDGAAAVNAKVTSGTWSYSVPSLADGPHNVSVVAVDNAGNVGSTGFSLVVDTTAPTLTVTSPSMGSGPAYSNSVAPEFSGTVSDGSGTGIASVLITIDGIMTVPASVVGNTWSYKGATLFDGNHEISIIATDKVGNQSFEAFFILDVDTIAPTVTVAGPSITGGVAYTNTGSPTISGTMADAGPSSGIASVLLSIDGNAPVAATVNGGAWSYNASSLSDGSHTISVVAHDNAGNSSTATTFTLKVDTAAPSVTITSPTITAGIGYSKTSSPTISGTVSDGAGSSGIASVLLSIDGNTPVAATVNAGAWTYNASGLSDGDHTISVVAKDNAGNSSAATFFTLKVDTAAPTLSVTSPTIAAGIAYSTTAAPTLSGTVADGSPSSGIASVLLTIDGSVPVAAIVSAGTWTYNASGLSDGNHTISVVATDNAGNSSTASSFTLKVDTVTPTLTVTSPTITAGIAYSKTGAPTISGTVTDGSPSTGIASVLLSIDGNAPVAATVNAGAWTYNASGLSDGNHTISVVAKDNAGNSSAATSFTLKVDTVAPTLTVTNPTITAGLAYSKTSNPTISGTVADAASSSGIASVMLSIDGNTPVAATINAGAWTYNASGLSDGNHTISVVATDTAGNSSAATSFTLKVDTVVPTLSVTSPTITAGIAYSKTASPTISGTVTDGSPSSGIASVLLSIDGNAPVAATVNAGAWTYNASGLSDGNHTISVVAKDNAGNSSAATSFTLKVDTVAPTLTVTNPTITAGIAYSKTSNPAISGTVADVAPSSGVASVMLSIDGNSPVAATVTNGNWSYNTSGLIDGTHTISVVATDNAGNQSTANSFTLKVDTLAPTLTVTIPAVSGGVAYSKTGSPAISGTVSDGANSSGIASVLLTIDGNAPVAATVNAGSWTYNASGLSDGNHTISVIAKDNAGNSSGTTSFTLKVDTVAPTLTVTAPTIIAGVATTNSNTPTFVGTVADANPTSGLASVTVSIDGGPAAIASVNAGNWTYSGASVANGNHSVVVTATDIAGNVTTDSFTLHVDNTLLTISIPGGPLTYTAMGSPITVAAGASVTDPGVASFVGGKLTVTITANPDPNDILTLVNQGFGNGHITVLGSTVYYGTTRIGSVTGGTHGSPLVVSFTSKAVTPVVALAVARDIQFSNNSSTPSTAPRTIEFVITDGRPVSSLPADVIVNVVLPHAAPVVTLNTNGITFSKQSPPVLLAPAATVTDQILSSFPGGTLTVSFSANGTAADNLLVVNQGQITVNGANVSYGANVIGTTSGGTGGTPLVISLNANAGVTATQALINAIAFANSSANPSTSARTVKFQLDDGAGGVSAAVTEKIKVVVPVITLTPSSSTLGYTKGNPAVTLLPSVTFADSAVSSFTGSKLVVSSSQSADQLTIQNVGGIKLSGTVITWNNMVIGSLSGNTVSLAATATQAAIVALIQSYGFSTTGATGARTVTFQFTDSLGNTASAAVVVSVTNGII